MKIKLEIILLAGLLFLGTWLRLYRVDAPLADWHSWRQADTAAVARNFVKAEFNLLYPQSDSLLALNDKGLENPNRWFINEFPLYNAIVALIYLQFGVNPMYGRLVSIFFAITGAFFLYLLVRRLLGVKTAILALVFYLLNPYNVFYGRVFMPDPTFVSLSIIALYWCVRWVESGRFRHGLLMAITFALATLVKPYALLIALPMAFWVFANWGLRTFTKPSVYLLAAISLLPLTLWRYHLSLHPEGSFASNWLLNGDGIRFKGSFFRWIIFDRFNRLIFATGGFVLFVVGFLSSTASKKKALFFVWTLAVLLYITVFAKGNVNHDYYQLPILAPGSVLVALGSLALIDLGKTLVARSFNTLVVLALFVLSLAFGWFEVRGFFNINNPAIVRAGAKIDEITEKDALVIAPYMGDPAFLYQTNRYGWPIGGDIEAKIKEGADYYVTTAKDEEYQKVLSSHQNIVYESDEFVIIRLTLEEADSR